MNTVQTIGQIQVPETTMQASGQLQPRFIDAKVARMIGLRVLGLVRVTAFNETVVGPFDPFDPATSPEMPAAYVYLNHCYCKEMAEAGWTRPAQMFGHYEECLAVVPRYSTVPALANELRVRYLVEPDIQHEWQPTAAGCVFRIYPQDSKITCYSAESETWPMAFCVAFLSWKTVEAALHSN